MKIRRSIPIAVLLSALIFGLATLVSRGLGRLAIGGLWLRCPWLKHALFPATLTLLSLGAIALFGEGRWRDFGFQRPHGPWWKFVFYGFLLGAGSPLLMLLTPAKGMGAVIPPSFVQIVVQVWICASLTEELLTRGWLQGFLEPMRDRHISVMSLRMSAPVLTSGLFFGTMHLVLLAHADLWTVGCVVCFTTCLGLLAATIRERTGSLIPAVWVHVAGNVGGALGGTLSVLIHLIRTGHVPK